MKLTKTKSALAVSAILALSVGSVSAATTHTMTGGTFDFYDAAGALSPQVTAGGDSHADVDGIFDMNNQTGSFSSQTAFKGNLWTADVASMFMHNSMIPVAFGGDPTNTTIENHTWSWDTNTYRTADYSFIGECNSSGALDGCATMAANASLVLWKTESNQFDFQLGQGQFAAGIFFDWSTSTDIPVLGAMQTSNYQPDGSMDVVSIDTDGDAVPGTAMWWTPATQADVDADLTGNTALGDPIGCTNCGPFPGQTPAFGGTMTAVSAVPVPAAVWLFGSGLLGLVGVARRKKA